MDRRPILAALIALTLLAAALRLPFLGHQSLWFDEIFTRDVVGEPTLGGLGRHLQATESTPPLYYVIAWLLGGQSAAAMRAIPAVALTLATPVSYLALRRTAGQRCALATAAIVAVSPILVSYSTDARAYGLFVLTAMLSVWGFSAALHERTWPAYAAWAAAALACVWTHYFGVFIVAGEALVLLKSDSGRRLPTLAWTSAIAACTLPLLTLVLRQTGDERAAFIAGMSLGSRLTGAVRQFAMGPNVPRTWLEAAGLALACGAIVGGAIIHSQRGDGHRALLAVAALAFVPPLALAVAGIEDRFYARNLVAIVPLAAAIATPAMLRLRAAPLCAYLALCAVTSVWVATDWRYEQVDWARAVRLAHDSQPAPLVSMTRMGAPVIRTYLGRAAVSSVTTARLWLAVEPVRRPGHRALGAQPPPSALLAALPQFHPSRVLVSHGFTLELLSAEREVTVRATDLHGALLFP